MRPPLALTAFSFARRRRADIADFEMHHMIVGVVGLDRQEGAGADMQRHEMAFDAERVQRFKQAGVKCRPAVGAATAPSSRA